MLIFFKNLLIIGTGSLIYLIYALALFSNSEKPIKHLETETGIDILRSYLIQ